jgi:hypothetical protein
MTERTRNGIAICSKIIERAVATDHPLTAMERAKLLAIFTAPAGQSSNALSDKGNLARDADREAS